MTRAKPSAQSSVLIIFFFNAQTITGNSNSIGLQHQNQRLLTAASKNTQKNAKKSEE